MLARSWLGAVAAVAMAAVCAAGSGSPAASASVQVQHRSKVTKVTSPDWAGYAALAGKGRHFRYVAADFTIPNTECNTTDAPGAFAVAAQWIGLDGYGRNHGLAEQIGVSESCGSAAVPHFQIWAWYRGASGSGSFLLCTAGGCAGSPNPGDKVALSVYFTGKTYRLIYHDVSAKVLRKFYLRCAKCRNTNASAEVINQVNSADDSVGYTVSFFGVRVTSTTGRHGTVAPQPRYWRTDQIFMADPAGTYTAVPSALLRQGRAFHVNV